MNDQMLLDRMSQMIRVGFVNARQPEKMRVKVTLPDTTGSQLVTNWLPVLCPRACGDMQYDLPDIGDQVLCLFLAYGLEQGFVIGSMYGRQTPPVASGDKWHRKFSDGAYLEYDRASHTLTADIPGTVNIKASQSITLEAPIIYLRGTLQNTAQDGSPGKSVFSGGMEVMNGGINAMDGDIVASGVSLASHTTEGVQPGAGISSHPTGGSGKSPGTAPVKLAALTAAELALIEAARLEALRDTVEESENPTEHIILCLAEIAEELAKRAEKDGREKDAKGLRYLASFFRKWLAGLPNEDLSKSTPAYIDFEWVLEFPRAKKLFFEWTELTKQPGTVFSPAAQKEIRDYVEKELEEKHIELEPSESYPFKMAGLEYFNLVSIPYLKPEEIDEEKLEGLFAAMGAFTIRAQAKGRAIKLPNNRWKIYLEQACYFVHDQFNFPRESGPEYWAKMAKYSCTLGYWSCAEKAFSMEKKSDTHYPLSNSDFISLRKKYARGEDFLVLSKPYCIDLPGDFSYEISCGK